MWSDEMDMLKDPLEGFDSRLAPFLGLKNRKFAQDGSSSVMPQQPRPDITQAPPINPGGMASYGQETDNPYDSPVGDATKLQSKSLSMPSQQLPMRADLSQKDPSQTPSMDSYRDFLASGTPDREKLTHQNFGQKLAAALAGGAIAYKSGAGQGLAAVDRMKNSKYEDAVGDYKLKGDSLRSAAELETSKSNTDFTRNAEMRRIMDTESNNARLARTADDEHANYQSLIDERKGNAGSQGWNYTTRETDGHRIGTKMTPTGPMTIDLGKVSEAPAEKDARDLTQFGKQSGIVEGREKRVGADSRAGTLGNEKTMADYHDAQTKAKELRDLLVKQAGDESNPNRQYPARLLAIEDVIRNHPELEDKVKKDETGKYTGEYDKSIEGLVNAELKKFNPHGQPGQTGDRFSLVP